LPKTSVPPPAHSALSDGQLWALATGALLSMHAEDRSDMLVGKEATPKNVSHDKEMLIKYWNIHNRDDLFKRLKWLETEGYRKRFDDLRKALRQHNDALQNQIAKRYHLSAPELQYDCQIVQNYADDAGPKSLLGWDYCRYIYLCRWAVRAGYMQEKEAWAKIMPAARLLQHNYDTWGELGMNYLIGRQFWSEEVSKKNNSKEAYDKIYRYLVTDKTSPWHIIPWDTDLTRGGKTGGY
jgi:hypothetical protein